MELRDPVAIYTAASNMEAHLICQMLIDAGVPAAVIEDVSQVGVWLLGLASQLHRPQIWIERVDEQRARPLLVAYEDRCAEQLAKEQGEVGASTAPIAVACEECGEESMFPASQTGTVQNCPHCRAYVDVGNQFPLDGWDAEGDAER